MYVLDFKNKCLSQDLMIRLRDSSLSDNKERRGGKEQPLLHFVSLGPGERTFNRRRVYFFIEEKSAIR